MGFGGPDNLDQIYYMYAWASICHKKIGEFSVIIYFNGVWGIRFIHDSMQVDSMPVGL
jgi:hypothetical protein